MGLGRYLGFRAEDEIVNSKRSQFKVKPFTGGDYDGVRYLEAKIGDGHDKTTGFKFGNPNPRENNPKIRENPDDEYCLIKLYEFVQSKCDDSQVRFFCRVDDSIE